MHEAPADVGTLRQTVVVVEPDSRPHVHPGPGMRPVVAVLGNVAAVVVRVDPPADVLARSLPQLVDRPEVACLAVGDQPGVPRPFVERPLPHPSGLRLGPRNMVEPVRPVVLEAVCCAAVCGRQVLPVMSSGRRGEEFREHRVDDDLAVAERTDPDRPPPAPVDTVEVDRLHVLTPVQVHDAAAVGLGVPAATESNGSSAEPVPCPISPGIRGGRTYTSGPESRSQKPIASPALLGSSVRHDAPTTRPSCWNTTPEDRRHHAVRRPVRSCSRPG